MTADRDWLRRFCYNLCMELSEEQRQKLRELGEKFDLELVLLYGSRIKGTSHEGSDVDIAVFTKKPIDFRTFLSLYSALSEVLAPLEGELDLVDLRGKGPLFLYQIFANSWLLYGDPTAYNEFRAFAFRNYFDSRDIFRLEKILVHRYQEYLNKTYAR